MGNGGAGAFCYGVPLLPVGGLKSGGDGRGRGGGGGGGEGRK